MLLVNREPLGSERVNSVKNYVPINPFTPVGAHRAPMGVKVHRATYSV